MRILIILIGLFVTVGCASSGSNPTDPWEDWNRGVYKFNKSIDSAVAKPLTKGYKAITPDALETGISNVFANLKDVPTMLNNLLQGKFLDSLSDFGRITVNTTVGVGGLFDPASDLGLQKHDEDFGQTLGKWGVGSGGYMMLPFLGPSTLRDTISLTTDVESNPLDAIEHIPTRNQATLLELIDKRSALMAYEDQLADAIDEYAFVRDIYLQNRRYKVLDGDIPFEEECDEDFEEDCDF